MWQCVWNWILQYVEHDVWFGVWYGDRYDKHDKKPRLPKLRISVLLSIVKTRSINSSK